MKKIILIVSLILLHQFSNAAASFEALPTGMKYFSESKKYSLSESTKETIGKIASANGMNLYLNPKMLPIDAIITDNKFERAILISANRRTNPEYLAKLYEHESGQFTQVKVNGQQLSVFFYNLKKNDVLKVFSELNETGVAAAFSLIIETANAAGYSDTATGGFTPSKTTTSETSVRTSKEHKYVLGEEFLGCGKGVINGLNNVAASPWNAGWSFGTSLKSLFDDPKAWWGRSVAELKELKDTMLNFREFIGKKWSQFQKLSPEDQSKAWCTYVGTPGLMGTIGYASKAGAAANGAIATKEAGAIGASEKVSSGSTGLVLSEVKVAKGTAVVSTEVPIIKLDARGQIPKGNFFGLKDAEINLLTPAQLKLVPNGTVLHSILGERVVVGIDRIDLDTRGGFLAYGVKTQTASTTSGGTAAVTEVAKISDASLVRLPSPSNAVTGAGAPAPAGLRLDPNGRVVPKGSFFGLQDRAINLITPEQYAHLPSGTVLKSIDGKNYVVGIDKIDGDTRGGFLAFGFTD